MDITQTFYDNMAPQYDKLFADWQTATKEQGALLDGIFASHGFARSARVLDCACGVGTQAIGLAALGYSLVASDISEGALAQARLRAEGRQLPIRFAKADFRALGKAFLEQFDIIIAMDNALPHMLTREDLHAAVKSIVERLLPGGIFVASIRDYDALLETKPPYSPPYVYKTEEGQRVAFQTWRWQGDCYCLTQYIIEDGQVLVASKYECEYRATRRAEIEELLLQSGCRQVVWQMPQESGFYQPIVIAVK